MAGKTELGRQGEELACRYLEAKGFHLEGQNFRRRRGEIDLIMRDDGVLVFVEVKTRKNFSFGQPAEAITPVKQGHIRYCAAIYLAEKGLDDCPVRFDAVEVMLFPGRAPKLHHIRNAF